MRKVNYFNDSVLRKELLSDRFSLEEESRSADSPLRKVGGDAPINPSDRDCLLWTRIKEGNVAALGELYDLYIDDLYPFGLALCSEKQLVMDAIHDLFLDIFKYKKNLAQDPQVKHYLLSSLKRKIFKKLTKKYRKFTQLEEGFLLERDLYESSTEKRIIDAENDIGQKARVGQAVEGLPKKQKMAVQMKFYEGKSYEEIAALMNITIETARTLIYRSILSLRNSLNNPFLLLLFLDSL